MTSLGWVVSKIAVRSFSSWIERDCFIPTRGWEQRVIVAWLMWWMYVKAGNRPFDLNFAA